MGTSACSARASIHRRKAAAADWFCIRQTKVRHLNEGSYLRLIDNCITQL